MSIEYFKFSEYWEDSLFEAAEDFGLDKAACVSPSGEEYFFLNIHDEREIELMCIKKEGVWYFSFSSVDLEWLADFLKSLKIYGEHEIDPKCVARMSGGIPEIDDLIEKYNEVDKLSEKLLSKAVKVVEKWNAALKAASTQLYNKYKYDEKSITSVDLDEMDYNRKYVVFKWEETWSYGGYDSGILKLPIELFGENSDEYIQKFIEEKQAKLDAKAEERRKAKEAKEEEKRQKEIAKLKELKEKYPDV